MSALFVTFILSLLTGATAVLVTSSYSKNWSDAKSEAALQLAEAGANEELNYISSRLQSYQPPFAHAPTTRQGQPLAGNPGTVDGTPGRYWVYATVPGTNNPWPGQGPVQITSTAVVWAEGLGDSDPLPDGARTVSRTVVIKANPKSLFSYFGLFGLDAANHNNQPSVAVVGNGRMYVDGKVGTNGIVQKGAGVTTYTEAYNFNGGYNFPNGAEQFNEGTLYSYKQPLVVPTVTEVLQNTFPEAGLTPWTWLATHNDNDQARQYAKSGPSLTNSGTAKVGFSKTPAALSNIAWTFVNPGPNGVRSLILPPGDYYLTGVDLAYDKSIELLIDNAGLTTPAGSNPDHKPVRLWINGAGTQDRIELAIRMTAPNDASTFRVFYNKDGAKLHIRRDNLIDDSDGPFTVSGCFYAVTARLDPLTNLPAIGGLMGTEIDLHGDSPSHNIVSTIVGSVFADRVQVIGVWKIIHPAISIGNDSDPAGGVSYDPDCDSQPCYSDGS